MSMTVCTVDERELDVSWVVECFYAQFFPALHVIS
jgi:hypothetical protein